MNLTQTPDGALDSLASDAENEHEEGAFMKPALKKRGRPKGAKNTKAGRSDGETIDKIVKNDRNEQIETLKQLTDPLCATFSRLGVKIAEDERAAMDKAQMDNMSTAIAKCIDRYAPNMLNEHADAIAAAVMIGMYSMQVYLIRQENLEKLRARKNPLSVVAPEVPSN